MEFANASKEREFFGCTSFSIELRRELTDWSHRDSSFWFAFLSIWFDFPSMVGKIVSRFTIMLPRVSHLILEIRIKLGSIVLCRPTVS
jgi:hypothetical protein